MKIKTTLILLLFILVGCQNKEAPQQTTVPTIIDLVSAFENKATLKLSSIASSVEYITLESSRKAILGGGARIFVSDSFIVSFGHKKIDLFNRKNGKHIREIGKYGRGPNEFESVQHVEVFDELTHTIRARGWDFMIEYNKEGKVIRRFKKPEDLKNANPYKDNIFVGYFMNRRGNEPRKIGFYNIENGQWIKTFPNYLRCDPKSSVGINGYEGWFYRFNDELRFKETFNDTIFAVDLNRLQPRYIFDAGQFKPPYRIKEYYKNYYTVHGPIIESSLFLFFKFVHKRIGYCAVYDKQNNNCRISESTFPIRTLSATKIRAFENDIDNFLPFYPMSINRNNELISAIPAYETHRWFQENPEKAAKLPPELQKLKNIKETDNPVVMIAKLRE